VHERIAFCELREVEEVSDLRALGRTSTRQRGQRTPPSRKKLSLGQEYESASEWSWELSGLNQRTRREPGDAYLGAEAADLADFCSGSLG